MKQEIGKKNLLRIERTIYKKYTEHKLGKWVDTHHSVNKRSTFHHSTQSNWNKLMEEKYSKTTFETFDDNIGLLNSKNIKINNNALKEFIDIIQKNTVSEANQV
jgi:hypothetical protein|tara:strand:- start:108 stop:419 length:312 start_codon:yes stop_codon:yes gene_type:complete